MHILCWDTTVLGKEEIQPDGQLSLWDRINSVIQVWTGVKELSWYGVHLECCS